MPTRVGFIFFPNGVIKDQWKSTGEESEMELSPTLAPLQRHRHDVNISSGLTQHHARANGDGDHARNASASLTGAQPRKTAGADIRVGQSVDQAAAEQIGRQTRLPSLELGIAHGRNAGNCDSGYSCAYSSSISWKTKIPTDFHEPQFSLISTPIRSMLVLHDQESIPIDACMTITCRQCA